VANGPSAANGPPAQEPRGETYGPPSDLPDARAEPASEEEARRQDRKAERDRARGDRKGGRGGILSGNVRVRGGSASGSRIRGGIGIKIGTGK
jgi:hypothetical protein